MRFSRPALRRWGVAGRSLGRTRVPWLPQFPSAQAGTVTFGTVGSVTYSVTVAGTGNAARTVTVANLPTGASFTPSTYGPCNLSQSACDFTLTVTSTGSGASRTPAGSSTISVKVDGVGTTGNATYVVAKKALSVNADANSKTYGDAEPTLTATLSGFVGTDNAGNSGITGSAACTRTAGESVAGSPYTITCAPGSLLLPTTAS